MSMPFGPTERIDNAKLEALAGEVAKQIKTEQDIAALSRQLLKLTVASALNAELETPLGYAKHAPAGRGTGNSRNGASRKTLKGDIGEVEIRTPRDRNGSFEPQLLAKGQRRLTAFDGQILALYAQGMSSRDIAASFEELYGAEVSHTVIANVTEAVWETVQAWQSRGLSDRLPGRAGGQVHQDGRVIKKTVHVALGVNLEGQKEVLGYGWPRPKGRNFGSPC